MWSIHSLALLPRPPGVAVHDRVIHSGQIVLFNLLQGVIDII